MNSKAPLENKREAETATTDSKGQTVYKQIYVNPVSIDDSLHGTTNWVCNQLFTLYTLLVSA